MSAARAPGPRQRGPAGKPSKGQRAFAVVLTAMLFAIVVLGFGLIFSYFDHRGFGLIVGGVFCALMVAGFVREQRRRG